MLLDGLVGMDDLCCGRVNNWDGLMEGRGVDNGDRTLVDNSGCVGQRNAGSVVDNGRGTSVVGQGIGACYGQNGSENEQLVHDDDDGIENLARIETGWKSGDGEDWSFL